MISLFKQNKFINIRGSFNYYVGTKEGRGGGSKGVLGKSQRRQTRGGRQLSGQNVHILKDFNDV